MDTGLQLLELLTSNGDVVQQWEEYFQVLLSLDVTSSAAKPEAWDSGEDLSITQAEVNETVRKLLGGKGSGGG